MVAPEGVEGMRNLRKTFMLSSFHFDLSHALLFRFVDRLEACLLHGTDESKHRVRLKAPSKFSLSCLSVLNLTRHFAQTVSLSLTRTIGRAPRLHALDLSSNTFNSSTSDDIFINESHLTFIVSLRRIFLLVRNSQQCIICGM